MLGSNIGLLIELSVFLILIILLIKRMFFLFYINVLFMNVFYIILDNIFIFNNMYREDLFNMGNNMIIVVFFGIIISFDIILLKIVLLLKGLKGKDDKMFVFLFGMIF